MDTCSEFENNFGNRGGALAILHYVAHFENVTFTNHRGPVILVSIQFCYNRHCPSFSTSGCLWYAEFPWQH